MSAGSAQVLQRLGKGHHSQRFSEQNQRDTADGINPA